MSIKIIECPRDAMQGFDTPISADDKIEYINLLLKCGFDVLDCGSFVSPKAVPQMADTKLVLSSINKNLNNTELLCIVANERGAKEASEIENISILGFPFSISESFQKRNTNHGIKETLSVLKSIIEICKKKNKKLVVYLSMGFGNPYGEPWSIDIALDYCSQLEKLGVKTISLSDTIGMATAKDIETLFKKCITQFPSIEFGVHLHTKPTNYLENISSAYKAGCRRFDSAIRGFGGCPFATDKLMGNLPTESLLEYLKSINEEVSINESAFQTAYLKAAEVFKI